MTAVTDVDVELEEKVREAIAQTERSFGGTFKRLKAESEALEQRLAETEARHADETQGFSARIAQLEETLGEKTKRLSELTLRAELEHQLRESGPVPEQFITLTPPTDPDDREAVRTAVSQAVTDGRAAWEAALATHGITPPRALKTANPTNPPSRDTTTVRDLRQTASRDVLRDMVRRGLLR